MNRVVRHLSSHFSRGMDSINDNEVQAIINYINGYHNSIMAMNDLEAIPSSVNAMIYNDRCYHKLSKFHAYLSVFNGKLDITVIRDYYLKKLEWIARRSQESG